MKQPFNSSKKYLVLASFFGFSSVALGAFGAHALKEVLSEKYLKVFETAVRYQMAHAIVLLFLPSLYQFCSKKAYLWASRLFTVGIILFSGSLYALCLTGFTKFGIITPLGGLCLLLAWGTLFVSFVMNKNNDSISDLVKK